MLKLYLVRHGETLWNQENRVLGRTDIPLNERGIAQAQALGAKLADVHFDLLLTAQPGEGDGGTDRRRTEGHGYTGTGGGCRAHRDELRYL